MFGLIGFFPWEISLVGLAAQRHDAGKQTFSKGSHEPLKMSAFGYARMPRKKSAFGNRKTLPKKRPPIAVLSPVFVRSQKGL
jgi:hypothetical protein